LLPFGFKRLIMFPDRVADVEVNAGISYSVRGTR
jgi:hypothetical protein